MSKKIKVFYVGSMPAYFNKHDENIINILKNLNITVVDLIII